MRGHEVADLHVNSAFSSFHALFCHRSLRFYMLFKEINRG